MNTKLDGLNGRLDGLNGRLDTLEEEFHLLNECIVRWVGTTEVRFLKINSKFDKLAVDLSTEFTNIRDRLTRLETI